MNTISQGMKRRGLLAAAAATSIGLALPQARAATPPEALPVDSLDSALIAVMKAGSAGKSFAARYAMLKPVVEASFDLELILQNSAGLLWPQIPPAQKTELGKLFRQYTIATYVSNFNAYGGQHFTTDPEIRRAGDSRIVSTTLNEQDGKAVKLAYVMREAGGAWKITDVLFEGTISKVAAQRSDFSGLIDPGNAARLIEALKKKIAMLSGGAIRD